MLTRIYLFALFFTLIANDLSHNLFSLSADCNHLVSEMDNVHLFFYLWYDVPSTNRLNSSFKHWNHEVLPHWEEQVNSRYPSIGRRFEPENNELHSPFYPLRGPY